MRLPIVALVVPILLSIVMWLITGSPLSLLFGLMGPVMALANYVDQRIHAKRTHAEQQQSTQETEYAQLQEQKVLEEEYRFDQLRSFPSSQFWSQQTANLRPFWAVEHTEKQKSFQIRIGVEKDTGLPVVLNPQAGLVVVGDDIEARSIMRSLAVQMSWRGGIEAYSSCDIDILLEPEVSVFYIEGAKMLHRSSTYIPSGVRYVLETKEGAGTLKDLLGQDSSSSLILWDLLTRAEHQRILDLYEEELKSLPSTQLRNFPDKIEAKFPFPPAGENARDAAPVYVGETGSQSLFIDLLEDGPHAIVVGKTGSGKTEFVKTWITGLCAGYSAETISFLIIDYKGGTGFQSLAPLPHIHAVVSDLGHNETSRIIRSLNAEVRTRELTLLKNGAHDIHELPDRVQLSRLVIVIDEYRALLEQEPELGHIITDIASRGRSLGIHLILATQRQAGVVSDSITANCSLRVCFAQTDKHESSALLGSNVQIASSSPPGRALLVSAIREVTEFQSALTSKKQLQDLCEYSWPRHSEIKPWLEPLPEVVTVADAPTDPEGLWLGIADYPEKQLQKWFALTQSSVLVVGSAGCGKTNTALLLSQQLGVNPIHTAEELWDVVCGEEVSRPVVIDDFDYLVESMDIEHKDELVQHMPSWLRYQRQSGTFVALTLMQQSRYELLWQPHFQATIRLINQNLPGRAICNETSMQIARVTPTQPSILQLPILKCEATETYAIVTKHVNKVKKHFVAQGFSVKEPGGAQDFPEEGPMVIIGSVDQWQENYLTLGKLKNTAHFVFDNCSPAEIRSLRVHSGLLPFVQPGTLLLRTPEGVLSRVRLSEDSV